MPATQDPAKGAGTMAGVWIVTVWPALVGGCSGPPYTEEIRRRPRGSGSLRVPRRGSQFRFPIHMISAREGFSIYIHTFGSWTGARIGTAHAVSLSGSEWSGLP